MSKESHQEQKYHQNRYKYLFENQNLYLDY